MPSFDVVSEVNVQEVDNAVNQASREAENRYDFKGKKYEIAYDKDKNEIKLSADEESRLDALLDMVQTKLMRRGIELGSVEVGKKEQMGGMMMRQLLKIKQGLETPKAKEIVKLIKDTKLKVDAAIQDNQVRVTGKNIDDLQEVIALLRSKQPSLKVPLQYINMRK